MGVTAATTEQPAAPCGGSSAEGRRSTISFGHFSSLQPFSNLVERSVGVADSEEFSCVDYICVVLYTVGIADSEEVLYRQGWRARAGGYERPHEEGQQEVIYTMYGTFRSTGS